MNANECFDQLKRLTDCVSVPEPNEIGIAIWGIALCILFVYLRQRKKETDKG